MAVNHFTDGRVQTIMMLMTLDEERVLLEKVQSGEGPAFQDFVEQYKKQIYFLALSLTGNHHDAEDLSQDVFLKAFDSIRKFRGDAKISSWLHRITVNTFLDQKRKGSFQIMKKKEDLDDVPVRFVAEHKNPEKDMEQKQIQQAIDAALGCLSRQQKTVFVLRHYQEMKLKDIAGTLQVTEGTVKSVLFRAIQKMQGALSEFRPQSNQEAL